MLDWVPSQPTIINLDTIFDALTTCMYDLYVYLNNVYISVAGYRFTLWNFVIGAMLIAVVTAACIPDTPVGSLGDSFYVPDEAAEFYDNGYFDREHFYDED